MQPTYKRVVRRHCQRSVAIIVRQAHEACFPYKAVAVFLVVFTKLNNKLALSSAIIIHGVSLFIYLF